RHEMPGADYLGILGGIFEGGRSMEAETIAPGRTDPPCGHRITATRLRIRIKGRWAEPPAIVLPAPSGDSCLLVVHDGPVDVSATAVAGATWERVVASLRCDPAFVLRVPREQSRDGGTGDDDDGDDDAGAAVEAMTEGAGRVQA